MFLLLSLLLIIFFVAIFTKFSDFRDVIVLWSCVLLKVNKVRTVLNVRTLRGECKGLKFERSKEIEEINGENLQRTNVRSKLVIWSASDREEECARVMMLFSAKWKAPRSRLSKYFRVYSRSGFTRALVPAESRRSVCRVRASRTVICCAIWLRDLINESSDLRACACARRNARHKPRRRYSHVTFVFRTRSFSGNVIYYRRRN